MVEFELVHSYFGRFLGSFWSLFSWHNSRKTGCLDRGFQRRSMIEVKTLPAERWREARELRLHALKTDPIAFGAAYEEEENLAEAEWQRRMKSALFALSDDKPVGNITYLFSDRVKGKHVARIFGVYVDPNYRGRGLGKKLLENALELIQENKGVVKVPAYGK